MEKDDYKDLGKDYDCGDACILDEEYRRRFGKGFMVFCTDCDYTALYILAKEAMERGYPLSDEEISSTIEPDFPQPDEIRKDFALGMRELH